jgi:ribosome recycling factor
MTSAEQHFKELETALSGIVQKLKQELSAIRGNRPSADMLQELRVNIYDQSLTIRELGSLSVIPPRTIQVTLWDIAAVSAVLKAINDAHLGLTASNDGLMIRASLSQLGNERRDELMKLVKKTAEASRIQVRARRDDAMKRMKDSEAKKEMGEDEAFRMKEKMQKLVEKTNADLEFLTDAKLGELGE